MSNHEIPGHDPAKKVVVGWDPPLQTLFAQVVDRKREEEDDDENDKFYLWVGCTWREIQSPIHLSDLLEPYAELTREMRDQLFRDIAGNVA